jgi:hypothetical protein
VGLGPWLGLGAASRLVGLGSWLGLGPWLGLGAAGRRVGLALASTALGEQRKAAAALERATGRFAGFVSPQKVKP